MFGRIAKLMLILTAIAPVGLVYAWVSFREGHSRSAATIVMFALVLLLVCWYLLKSAREQLEKLNFKPVTIEAADRENIAFMLLYLSPLFTSQLGQLNLDILIPTIIIFAALSATGYSYHFNPLLGLVGWHFYKVTSADGVAYVLVTRKQLRRASDIANVGQLTDYILIDFED